MALANIGTYWEGMPKAEQVLSLTAYDAAPTIDEFLGLFSGPLNLGLESERVWPIPQVPEIK